MSLVRPGRSEGITLLALLVANLVPLVGVVRWGWQPFDVVVLYWIEVGIVGIFNAPRIALGDFDDESSDTGSGDTAGTDTSDSAETGTDTSDSAETGTDTSDTDAASGTDGVSERIEIGTDSVVEIDEGTVSFDTGDGRVGRAIDLLSTVLAVVVLTGGYGFMWGIVGAILFSLPELFDGGATASSGSVFSTVEPAVLSMAAGHLVSFLSNFLRPAERRNEIFARQIRQSLSRLATLHTGAILGAFVVMALGSPLPLLVLLIVLKTGIDLVGHRDGGDADSAESSAPVEEPTDGGS